MKRFALIAPFLTHYRKYFYEKLNNELNNEVVFYFQDKIVNDGRPGISISKENNIFRSYRNKDFHLGKLKLSLSVGLLFAIRRSKIKVIILEGSTSNFTSWIIILFKRVFRVKVVIWACGWQPYHKSILVRKIKKIAENIFYTLGDSIICYSTKARGYLQEIGIRTPLFVAFNGIDVYDYNIKHTNVELGANILRNEYAYKKVFLYVGGIFEGKGLRFLVDVFSKFSNQYSDCILWVIGDGPLRLEIQNYVIDNFIDNIFFGRIEENVDKYFKAADFFVLPGVGGLALNQSMLWGTPCIVSEADGTEDDLVINLVTGLRFVKNSPESLFDALEDAYNINEVRYQEMSTRSRNLILSQSNTDKMVSVFKKVISDFI